MYRLRSTNSAGGRFAAARLVTGIGVVIAVIEIIYILLVLLKANVTNGAYVFFHNLAEPLALFFPGLFSFDSPELTVTVNYGLAAVFWLVVTGFVARLVA